MGWFQWKTSEVGEAHMNALKTAFEKEHPDIPLRDEAAAGVNRTLLNDLLLALRRRRDEGRRVQIVEHDMKGAGGRGWDRVASVARTGTVGLGVGATVLAAAWLTLGSLRWPLVHDGPLMHYIAARILAGAVPYRDLFDMNFPGVYLVHVVGLVFLGRGDAAFRAFDLVILALTAAGLAGALRPFGWAAGLGGAALFWLYHVAGGAWRAGQRDLILCAVLAWTVAAALEAGARPRLAPLAAAGLGLGAAVWIKPYAVLLLPGLLGLAWRMPSRRRALGALGIAVLAPAIPIVAWLGVTGGLGPFLDIVLRYLVPLYSQVGRVSLETAVREQHLGPELLAALGMWAVAGVLVLVWTGEAGWRLGTLIVGVAYGVLHYWIQGKGWEYHLYPFALFAIALGAAGLGAALRDGRGLAVGGLVAVLGLTVCILAVKGAANQAPAWIERKEARVLDVAAALAPTVAAGETVQVLDTTDGGIHALYRLEGREPTRFLYDFHFYQNAEHPYVRRLRAELLDGLRARPPGAVVLFEGGWPAGGYERIERFPALRAWLDGGYALAREGDGYRLYRRVR